MVETVWLLSFGAEQMRHGVAPGDEQLRDQTPVAAVPIRLGAHEAGGGLGELFLERPLPAGRPHAGGVAPERGDAEARERFLARLAAESAAQLDGVAVDDAGPLERHSKRPPVELRVSSRAGKAPNVDERLDLGSAQRLDQLVERTDSVANREHIVHRIAPLMVGSGGDG